MENTKANKTNSGDMYVNDDKPLAPPPLAIKTLEPISDTIPDAMKPRKIPINPPRSPNIDDSIMNSSATSLSVVPNAFNTPICLVLSQIYRYVAHVQEIVGKIFFYDIAFIAQAQDKIVKSVA